MLTRARWFFAAGCVLLACMLAAVAYGAWHLRKDAERDHALAAAQRATAVAAAERDQARAQNRLDDSLVALQTASIQAAKVKVAGLQARVDSLKRVQPQGDFHGVPEGAEPIGISWRELYFLTDLQLKTTQSALDSSEAKSAVLLRERDRLAHAVNTDSIAIVQLNNTVAVALHANDCHIAFVIQCPSRKASFLAGSLVTVLAFVGIKQHWFSHSPGATYVPVNRVSDDRAVWIIRGARQSRDGRTETAHADDRFPR